MGKHLSPCPVLPFHALQERCQRIIISFLSSEQSPHIEDLGDKQSGLSIWPYCFHPLISLVLTVLMRKQMHEAANYLLFASEHWKKTQHLIVSFELGPFKSNKVEIFTKGTALLKNMFSFHLEVSIEYWIELIRILAASVGNDHFLL